MKIKRILQSIVFLLPFLIEAQTYPFINYGVKDGLSQSNVSAIVQDKSGFLWLATESGVSKFDGINFTNYTTENGLADNHVSTLLMDSKGNIWMGHGNGSLTKYDGKTFKAIQSEVLPKDKTIYALYEDKSGSIWISTATYGAIVLIDPSKNLQDVSNYKVYSSKEGLSQYVFSVFEDRNENKWFLSDIGIKILNKKANQFEFFRPEGMPPGQVTSFSQNASGNFLIGTSTGNISEYNTTTQKLETIISSDDYTNTGLSSINNIVYAIHEDKTGHIWASIYNNGVCRYNRTDKKIKFFNTSNGLLVNKIKCIAEDREGSILLGTLEEGLEIFKGEKFVSFSKKDGLMNNQIWSICQDQKANYWFGTNEGVTLYDPKESSDKAFKTISLLEILGNNNVRSIARDKKGHMWIGTWGGKIAEYDVEQSQFVSTSSFNEALNPFVSCIMVDTKNTLWVGTADGLSSMNLNSNFIHTYRTVNGLSDNDISCLFEDSNGNIWIGTKQKGISVFDGTAFKKINKTNGLANNNITSIAEDRKHRIWIGTEGGGVFIYENNAFINYKAKDGLGSDFVTLISLDKNGFMWLGTNKGLCKYDDQKKIFYSYSKNDGFTGVETKPKAVYHDTEGNVWFGTVNGAFKYDPKQDIPTTLEPLTHITRFKVNEKDYPVTSTIKLSYKENSLHFEYIGIALSNPDEVAYKIMLEGYDEDWKPFSKKGFDIYSNLPSGNYTLKLIACNKSGICNKEPVTMSITITPPFWKTWWFYITIILLGVIIISSYIKIRERKLIVEKKILEDKVKERTAEIVEKNIQLDEKNKDITASIRYAKRIQNAILPPDEIVKRTLPKTFILFKPKDIVSGDFYWLANKKDKIFFAAVDCTGHGVPGAFMSIVGHNLLDRIIGEQGLTQPAEILDALNKGVSDTLHQSQLEAVTIRDGMDIALCSFDYATNILEYAGAYNPLWLIKDSALIEIKADKFPIGNFKPGENKKFTNHSVQLNVGDSLYIFSDGYADQFGGPNEKKFKYSTFKQLLLDTQHLSMEEQGEVLYKTIEDWRGTLEQVDDILVIGTRL